MSIHPSAIIDPSAEIDSSVKVGAYAIVGPRVKVGPDSQIMAHAFVHKDTEIGARCRIFPFASVGADPQDIKYQGERTLLKIDDDVTVRESASIHRGTAGGGGLTHIGEGSLVMATTHIAHDCILGKGVILSSYAVLAGHIHMGDGAIIGGLTAIHQFTRIGEQAFLGGASSLSKDLPPYIAGAGMRDLVLAGPNVVGLKRRGYSDEVLTALNGAFKIICRNHRPLAEVLQEAEEKHGGVPEAQSFINFYKNSQRGVYR